MTETGGLDLRRNASGGLAAIRLSPVNSQKRNREGKEARFFGTDKTNRAFSNGVGGLFRTVANGISGQLYSDMMVSDRLKNQLHTDHLHPRQYLYGMLDSLMEICGLPDTKVYTYREARNRILAEFAPALDDSYFSSMLNVIDVAASLGALGSKELISRLVHFSFYPEHTVAGENVILTVAPYEYALAQLVTYMMKELEEE